MMLTGLPGARDALRRKDPAALLGERECIWLDVKEGLYALNRPKGPEELAKDVAAFANTKDGGLLLVGYSTRKEHGEEVLEALNPVPRRLVDLDRYRQIIASRVMPALREVVVGWVDCDNETGVLFVEIPRQPRSSQLFAVPAPTGTEQVSKLALAVPIRRGDGMTWLAPREIQHYVALGWTYAGDMVDRLERAISSTRAPQRGEQPEYEIGGGEPGWKGVFQRAFNELAQQGLPLGDPATEVYRVGPGFVQHFEMPTEQFGWVLCARPNQRPVAVAGEVWQALQDEGSGALDGDALGALGFPVGDSATTRVIDRHTTRVELSGGRWGPGWLHRASDEQGWWWEPVPKADTTISASSRNWTSTPAPPQLRARVLATLPWAGTDDLAITTRRQEALVQNLPSSALAGIATTLSLRRGAELRLAEWKPGPNPNASDRLSYSSVITASDGRAALSAEVMMTLPPAATSSTVVTCAEVRIEEFAAWADALGAGQDPAPAADLR